MTFRFLIHVHEELEGAAFTNAVTRSCYNSSVTLYDLLHNRQTQPYTLTIHLCRSFQLAKFLEKVGKVFFIDTDSRIFNLNDELAG